LKVPKQRLSEAIIIVKYAPDLAEQRARESATFLLSSQKFFD
jgi:hypothetical protein